MDGDGKDSGGARCEIGKDEVLYISSKSRSRRTAGPTASSPPAARPCSHSRGRVSAERTRDRELHMPTEATGAV